jgi:hypothetical protein
LKKQIFPVVLGLLSLVLSLVFTGELKIALQILSGITLLGGFGA